MDMTLLDHFQRETPGWSQVSPGWRCYSLSISSGEWDRSIFHQKQQSNTCLNMLIQRVCRSQLGYLCSKCIHPETPLHNWEDCLCTHHTHWGIYLTRKKIKLLANDGLDPSSSCRYRCYSQLLQDLSFMSPWGTRRSPSRQSSKAPGTQTTSSLCNSDCRSFTSIICDLCPTLPYTVHGRADDCLLHAI